MRDFLELALVMSVATIGGLAILWFTAVACVAMLNVG